MSLLLCVHQARLFDVLVNCVPMVKVERRILCEADAHLKHGVWLSEVL